jgi:ApaG protein
MSDPRYQIDVSVVTRYLAEQSQPEQTASPSPTPSPCRTTAGPAKLMSRHWVITDGDGQSRKCAAPAWSASNR